MQNAADMQGKSGAACGKNGRAREKKHLAVRKDRGVVAVEEVAHERGDAGGVHGLLRARSIEHVVECERALALPRLARLPKHNLRLPRDGGEARLATGVGRKRTDAEGDAHGGAVW